jgi:hypothetical protein
MDHSATGLPRLLALLLAIGLAGWRFGPDPRRTGDERRRIADGYDTGIDQQQRGDACGETEERHR